MLKFLLGCLTSVGFVIAAHAEGSTGAHQVVRFQLGADQKLLVTYHWPKSCESGLQFVAEDPRASPLQAKGVPLDFSAEVSAMRLEVPLSADPEGSGGFHYPWAHPVGSGVYIYLPYYRVKNNCGTAQYVLDAPGVMLSDGIQSGPVIATNHANEASSAVLFPTPPHQHTKQSVYIDSSLGQQMAQELDEVFHQGRSFYQSSLPNAGFRPAGLVVGVTQDGGPVKGFGGDATNVIRLHYYNLPLPLGATMRTKFKLTLLHELAHRFHPESMARTALYPLPGEGGADFLRWSAALSLGLINKTQAAEMFDVALANCLQKTGATPWMELGKRVRFSDRVPYDCGFVAYAVGLSMRQGSGTAMDRMDALFAVHTRFANFDFPHVIECSGAATCTAKWLPRMFGQHETFAQVVDDWAFQTGLLEREPEHSVSTAPNQQPICAGKSPGTISADVPPDDPGSRDCRVIPATAHKVRYRLNLEMFLANLRRTNRD